MENNKISERLSSLRCPNCKSKITFSNKSQKDLICVNCQTEFPVLAGNCVCMLQKSGVSATKKKIQEFWGDTCKQWYSEFDENLTSDKLYSYLDDLEKMFRYRTHLAVTEMELGALRGKNILEIGSGGGSHSSLFKRYGANMTSVDITLERVLSTANKLALVEEGSAIVVQADAEHLPFEDDSFDIVYSNGVLHHSEDTNKCIDEVYRVLKPEGRAVLMLYSRHSAQYWFNILPKTILNGSFFTLREAERIGIITEGRPKHQNTRNPITRVYSEKKIWQLLEKFKIDSLRKNGFLLYQIPVIGRLRTPIMRLTSFCCGKEI